MRYTSAADLFIPLEKACYLKKSLANNTLSERHSLSIIFAVVHRLSELSRYDPNGLDRHLCGSANWLLTEFIEEGKDAEKLTPPLGDDAASNHLPSKELMFEVTSTSSSICRK